MVSLPPGVPSSAPPSAREEIPRPVDRWRPAPKPSERSLPSVIVDVGSDIEYLISQLEETSPEDESVLLPLLAAGEAALPGLAREFPGTLWFDRNQPHARIPEGRDVSPIGRAFVAFGHQAVPYLIPLLEHADPDVRYYATVVASAFLHPDLVDPAGRRLFDRDAGVRSAAYRALSVLYACEAEFIALIDKLRAIAADGRKLLPQVTAVEALGRLRDTESIEFLVSLLESSEEKLVRAAHASLVRLTCQDFGTSKKKWRGWYAKNASAHRVEWLIDALMHQDERLRRRAGDELEHLTQEFFGYEPGLGKRARQTAQKRYRDWWYEVGARMFLNQEPGRSGHAPSQ